MHVLSVIYAAQFRVLILFKSLGPQQASDYKRAVVIKAADICRVNLVADMVDEITCKSGDNMIMILIIFGIGL